MIVNTDTISTEYSPEFTMLEGFNSVNQVESNQDLCFMYPTLYQETEKLLSDLGLNIDQFSLESMLYSGEMDDMEYLLYLRHLKRTDYLAEVSITRRHEVVTSKSVMLGERDEILEG